MPFTIESEYVRLSMTEMGGQLGPISFRIRGDWVKPLALAPWSPDELDPSAPEILKQLRGDFFCMPFGSNETPFNGERHPLHGETANESWSLIQRDKFSFSAQIQTRIRPGIVRKHLYVSQKQPIIYSRHTLSDYEGLMCFGHHAMLDAEPGLKISTSPIFFGQVFPGVFESPDRGGHQFLKAGARFSDLRDVEASDGSHVDLTDYPARPGFEDLALVSADQNSLFAWSAAVFKSKGYVWISLKNPRQLASTVFWFSNGGREYEPWNGRHRNVIGIEEVTAYFHFGLAESVAENPMSQIGIPTHVMLHRSRPFIVSNIMCVLPIPDDFSEVESIVSIPGGIRVTSPERHSVDSELDLGFLE